MGRMTSAIDRTSPLPFYYQLKQILLTDLRERDLAAGDRLPGDLLVVGSSRHGPLARVFLGSTATKIVRASPVPVVVVPRGSAGAHTVPDDTRPGLDPAE